jgi:hypothetical protein
VNHDELAGRTSVARDAMTSGRIPGGSPRSGVSNGEQHPDQVDTGTPSVLRLDKPWIDVDELRSLARDDHVCRQCSVPAERSSEGLEPVARLG